MEWFRRTNGDLGSGSGRGSAPQDTRPQRLRRVSTGWLGGHATEQAVSKRVIRGEPCISGGSSRSNPDGLRRSPYDLQMIVEAAK